MSRRRAMQIFDGLPRLIRDAINNSEAGNLHMPCAPKMIRELGVMRAAHMILTGEGLVESAEDIQGETSERVSVSRKRKRKGRR